jgi:hypothetical protein
MTVTLLCLHASVYQPEGVRKALLAFEGKLWSPALGGERGRFADEDVEGAIALGGNL